MTKPLSCDPEQRVIAAIDAGMSCRAAAGRFGVAPSAAVTWRRFRLETGSASPRAQGGDARSGRIEAVGPAVLAMVDATPHVKFVEIAGRLEREHGARIAPSTAYRFFRRRGRSFRRNPPTPASSAARTSSRRAGPGSRRSRIRALSA